MQGRGEAQVGLRTDEGLSDENFNDDDVSAVLFFSWSKVGAEGLLQRLHMAPPCLATEVGSLRQGEEARMLPPHWSKVRSGRLEAERAARSAKAFDRSLSEAFAREYCAFAPCR